MGLVDACVVYPTIIYFRFIYGINNSHNVVCDSHHHRSSRAQKVTLFKFHWRISHIYVDGCRGLALISEDIELFAFKQRIENSRVTTTTLESHTYHTRPTNRKHNCIHVTLQRVPTWIYIYLCILVLWPFKVESIEPGFTIDWFFGCLFCDDTIYKVRRQVWYLRWYVFLIAIWFSHFIKS